MANSFVGIDEPGTIDKKLDTEQLVVGANTVERERVQVAGASDVAVASVVNAAPSAEYGLVTRNIPSGTQPVSGTVTANAGTGTLATDPIDRAARLVGQVEGRAADGVAVAGNPVLVAGQDGTNAQSLKTDAAGELQIDVLSSALPTGAATAALQLPDSHNVTVDNAAGAAAVNIQDGGNAITVDGTVNIGTFPDNEPFNVAQVGGSAVEVAGAGRQEVLARQPAVETLLSADGTARTILYASVNATADGDNAIVAAVGGQSVYVLGYVLTATGAGTILLQDTAGSPVVHGRIRAGADGGGASYAGGPTCPAFVTAVGTGLEISNPAGVDTLGHITYLQY